VVADGDAVAAAESGDHASESVASAGDTVATSVQEDAIAADAGNDHEVVAADANGEDAAADALAAAPADGGAIEAASEVGGSDSVAEAHAATAASSDCSLAPAPSALEAPVDVPVKTKGSAQYVALLHSVHLCNILACTPLRNSHAAANFHSTRLPRWPATALPPTVG
jgi:hypothetical protein